MKPTFKLIQLTKNLLCWTLGVLLISCQAESKLPSETIFAPSDFIISIERSSLKLREATQLRVALKLGKKAETDLHIHFGLIPKNPEEKAYTTALGFVAENTIATQYQLLVPAGQAGGSFFVQVNKDFKLPLEKDHTFLLKITAVEGKKLDLTAIESKEITLKKPDPSVVLSPAQEAILARHTYLKKWIGNIAVTTTVTVNNKNAEKVDAGFPIEPQRKTYKGSSLITLSERSNLEQPVLEILTNAFGLEEFAYMVYKKLSIEDKYSGKSASDPTSALYGALPVDMRTVWGAVKWTQVSEETFTMALDNLIVQAAGSNNQKGHIKFVEWKGMDRSQWVPDKRIKGSYVQYIKNIYAVNFRYKHTAWERFMDAKEDNAALQAVYQKYIHKSGFGNYLLPDPNYHLFSASMLRQSEAERYASVLNPNEDYKFYTHGSRNLILDEGATSAFYDNTKGEMKFKFMMDFRNAADWVQVEVCYTSQK